MSEESASGGWKVRYETALQEMSAESRAASKLEARLRSAISRLAVLGLGADRELDRRLDDLRQAIHADASSEVVLRSVEAISARVRLLSETDAARQPIQGEDAHRRFLMNLLLLVRQLSPSDARIANLLGRVRGADERDIPSLSMAVENLVAQKLTTARKNESPDGLIGRLFGGNGRQPSQAGAEALQLLVDRLRESPVTGGEPDLQALSQRLEKEGSDVLIPVATELADWLEQGLSAANEAEDSSNSNDVLPAELLDGGKPLSQIVTALRLPDEFADTADALTRQAGQAFSDPRRLTGWLSELAGLIRHFRTQLEQERKGLHRFLEKTLNRLAELDGHFDAEDEARSRAAEKAHGLDQQVDGEIDRLKRSMESGLDMDKLQEKISRHLNSLGKGIRLRRQLEDDRERAMEQRLREMRDRVGELEAESDHLKDSLKRESRRSVLDPLTRLPNRRAWEERFAYERARQQRRRQPLSLMLCALDDIALINDRLGPEAGDVAIADFAEKLAESMGPGEFVARLEGVEFVLLIPDRDAERVMSMAQNLGERLSTGNFVYEDIPFSLSGIFGVAELTEEENAESAIRRARQAMREAREKGQPFRLAEPSPEAREQRQG